SPHDSRAHLLLILQSRRATRRHALVPLRRDHLAQHLFPFFFTAPAPTQLYTLSLHDALPISHCRTLAYATGPNPSRATDPLNRTDRKSTRLNSSHVSISYAVFCLKKKMPAKSTAYLRPLGSTSIGPDIPAYSVAPALKATTAA